MKLAENYQNPLVILDSMYTHNHVAAELKAYSPLIKPGGYLVVFDIVIEDMPNGFYSNRPWDVGDNPKTAVREFISENEHFVIDRSIEEKLLLTTCTDGFLRRVK